MSPQAQEFYSTLTGIGDYNVTLPMILSEWHKLYNNSLKFGVFTDRLATELGKEYWMNWMPDNSTHVVTGTLQQRSLESDDYIPAGFHSIALLCSVYLLLYPVKYCYLVNYSLKMFVLL